MLDKPTFTGMLCLQGLPIVFTNLYLDNSVTLSTTCVSLSVHIVQLKEREEEVTAELLTDRACALSAVYYLLQARLDR
jgi:hypothetical protein